MFVCSPRSNAFQGSMLEFSLSLRRPVCMFKLNFFFCVKCHPHFIPYLLRSRGI